MRTGADRLRHALCFELIGVVITSLIASRLLGMTLSHMGAMSIMLATIATLWNYVYNLQVDKLMLRYLGRLDKTWDERVWHAIGFEGGLLLVALPLVAWWLSISLWQALLLDLGFVFFYLVYAFVYNLAYDKVFPVPALALR